MGSIAALLVFLIMASTPALAEARDYGTFLPENSIGYQADLDPFNDGKFAESTNFSCVLSDGYSLGDDRQLVLSDIMRTATKIYANQLEKGDFRDGKIFFEDSASDEETFNDNFDAEDGAGGRYENLGFASGKRGMQEYIRAMQAALRAGTWAPTKDTKLRPTDYAGGSYTFNNGQMIFDTGDEETENTDAAVQKKMANLFDPNAYAPIAVIKRGEGGLPEGCPFKPFAAPDSLGFKDIINDFEGAFISMITFPFLTIVEGAYSTLQPAAFKFTFWTPHSERGDVFWTVSDSCESGKTTTAVGSSASMRNSCRGATPLGYSKENLDVSNQGNGSGWYLRIASFIKWMVSGTYFLLIFIAAGVYMFRGNTRSNLNLMRMLPLLFMSIILTLFTPFLMGAVISFANLTVQTLFSPGSLTSVGSINLIFAQSGVIVGGGELFQRLVQVVVGSIATWTMLLFIIFNVIRQVALVILVVTAPIAVFCIINPSWRGMFMKWVRALLAIAFLPVVMALILKISLSINPLINSPATAYGTMTGLLGIILLVATLYGMTKIARAGKDFVMGQSSTATGAMAGAGAAMAGTDSAILQRAGAVLNKQAGQAENQGSTLIPKGRGSAAGANSPAGLPAGAGGASVGGGAGVSAGEEHPKAKARRELSERREAQHMAKSGRHQIGEQEYHQLLAQQSAIEQAGGDPMSELGYRVEEGVNGTYYKVFGAAGQPSDQNEQQTAAAPVDTSRGDGEEPRKKKKRRQRSSFENEAQRQNQAAGRATGGAPASQAASQPAPAAAGSAPAPQAAPAPGKKKKRRQNPAAPSASPSAPGQGTSAPPATAGENQAPAGTSAPASQPAPSSSSGSANK